MKDTHFKLFLCLSFLLQRKRKQPLGKLFKASHVLNGCHIIFSRSHLREPQTEQVRVSEHSPAAQGHFVYHFLQPIHVLVLSPCSSPREDSVTALLCYCQHNMEGGAPHATQTRNEHNAGIHAHNKVVKATSFK